MQFNTAPPPAKSRPHGLRGWHLCMEIL